MAEEQDLLLGDQFSVDGTLLKSWLGHKSVRPKNESDNSRPPVTGMARSVVTTPLALRRTLKAGFTTRLGGPLLNWPILGTR